MGTPDFSVPILQGLIDNYNVLCVVTKEDKPVGRGNKIKYSPVKQLALKQNIKIMQPKKIKESIEEIKSLKPDIIVTCAYGQILPKELLQIPPLGCINVHASLLPSLRGGAPIHHAIMDGYDKTGITIMYMAEGMDDGDIISQKEIKIDNIDTVETLHDKLSILGKNLLLETLPSIISKTNKRIKQDPTKVTFGYNITKEDEKLDFNKPMIEVYNKVRGLNSWPVAYTKLDGKIIKVYECYTKDRIFKNKQNGEITNIYKDGFGVKVKDGEVIITKVKPEGKRKMNCRDYINGMKSSIVGKILK